MSSADVRLYCSKQIDVNHQLARSTQRANLSVKYAYTCQPLLDKPFTSQVDSAEREADCTILLSHRVHRSALSARSAEVAPSGRMVDGSAYSANDINRTVLPLSTMGVRRKLCINHFGF